MQTAIDAKRAGNRLVDLTGQRFGRLVVKEYCGKSKWLCQCDCGNETIVSYTNLHYGRTVSCRCFQLECMTKRKIKHRQTGTRLYDIWAGMKVRCYNKKNNRYSFYGGKNIGVCDEWRDNFTAFREWSLSHGYRDDLTIDRIDNSQGYSPDNCRWTDKKTQSRNRTNCRFITFNGQSKTGTEWSEITGIPYRTIRDRIYRYGWSVEEALTRPVRKMKNNVKVDGYGRNENF